MTTNRSMPPAVVILELAYSDVRMAVDWLCSVLGFTERLRIDDHRAQLVFGAGSVIVTKRSSPVVCTTSHAIMVRVDDVDSHYAHARQSGATIVSTPIDYPYGERQYTLDDPGGHRWTFSQTVSDIDPAVWGGTLLLDADD